MAWDNDVFHVLVAENVILAQFPYLHADVIAQPLLTWIGHPHRDPSVFICVSKLAGICNEYLCKTDSGFIPASLFRELLAIECRTWPHVG